MNVNSLQHPLSVPETEVISVICLLTSFAPCSRAVEGSCEIKHMVATEGVGGESMEVLPMC